MGKTKPGFYAVARGRNVGIYKTWDQCNAQVNGFGNARYKKFDTVQEAEKFIKENTNGTVVFASSSETATKQATTNLISASRSTVVSKTPATPAQRLGFDVQYSGTKRTLTSFRGELSGGSFVSSVASPHLLQPLQRPTNSVPARDISTSTAQFRRQLKVTEERITNMKRKHSDDGVPITLSSSSGSVTNLERFTVDNNGFVVVYTDGACQANGKKGALAGIGIWFGDEHDLNVSEPVLGRQTNNTAEIQATERAILQAKSAGVDKLNIQTDSQFVINCVTKWMVAWKRNGWKLKDGKPVKNRVELERLNTAMQDMEIKWTYIAGHKGHYGNEQADRLAVEGANKRLKLS